MVNFSYSETHEIPIGDKRKKRKRVGEYDPRANKADKHYTNTYGL